MTQTGVRLELPNGNVYEFTEDLIVDENQNPQPIYDGGGNFETLFKRFVDSLSGGGGAGTPMQSAIVSTGAGQRSFNVEAQIYKGSSDQFGGVASSADARRKAQQLMNDLAESIVDANSPATFEWYEYSDTGKFEPISVIPLERDIDRNNRDPNSSSAVGVRFTLVESADLSQTIDSVNDASDLSLHPLGNTTPRIPLPLDSLNLGSLDFPQGLAEAPLSAINQAASGSVSPSSLATQLRPGALDLRGVWRGADVPNIVSAVKSDILSDGSVEAVEVVANNVPGPVAELAGTYTLGEGTSLPAIDPRVEGLHGFNFDLRER